MISFSRHARPQPVDVFQALQAREFSTFSRTTNACAGFPFQDATAFLSVGISTACTPIWLNTVESLLNLVGIQDEINVQFCTKVRVTKPKERVL
jgi:hypothetical protein